MILSLEPSATLVEGQGSPELISAYGAQTAIRPRCIGNVELEPNVNLSIYRQQEGTYIISGIRLLTKNTWPQLNET